MAHPGHEFAGIRARIGTELIAGMPQIVEVNARQTGCFESGQPDAVAEVGVCQRRTARAGEDEQCVLGKCVKVLAQVRCDQVGEGDDAASGP